MTIGEEVDLNQFVEVRRFHRRFGSETPLHVYNSNEALILTTTDSVLSWDDFCQSVVAVDGSPPQLILGANSRGEDLVRFPVDLQANGDPRDGSFGKATHRERLVLGRSYPLSDLINVSIFPEENGTVLALHKSGDWRALPVTSDSLDFAKLLGYAGSTSSARLFFMNPADRSHVEVNVVFVYPVSRVTLKPAAQRPDQQYELGEEIDIEAYLKVPKYGREDDKFEVYINEGGTVWRSVDVLNDTYIPESIATSGTHTLQISMFSDGRNPVSLSLEFVAPSVTSPFDPDRVPASERPLVNRIPTWDSGNTDYAVELDFGEDYFKFVALADFLRGKSHVFLTVLKFDHDEGWVDYDIYRQPIYQTTGKPHVFRVETSDLTGAVFSADDFGIIESGYYRLYFGDTVDLGKYASSGDRICTADLHFTE